MRRIRFREEARNDLAAIQAFHDSVDPDIFTKLLTDINRSLDQLQRFPLSGMQVAGREFRRIVTRKYHFRIAYSVGEEWIDILGVFRFQDREK